MPEPEHGTRGLAPLAVACASVSNESHADIGANGRSASPTPRQSKPVSRPASMLYAQPTAVQRQSVCIAPLPNR
jgi:hypothetical protein